MSGPVPSAELPADPALAGPTALGPNAAMAGPDIQPAVLPTVPAQSADSVDAADGPASPNAESVPSARRSNEAPPIKFARQLARLLFPSRSLPTDGDAAVTTPVPSATTGAHLERPSQRKTGPGAKIPASRGEPSAAAKRSFMSATFTYNLATSIMLVVQQVLLFSLAVQDQAGAASAAPRPAFTRPASAFALATLTGALRIPGNYLGGWLSGKTDQKNLAGAWSHPGWPSLGPWPLFLDAHHHLAPGGGPLLADWFIGGFEEVPANTRSRFGQAGDQGVQVLDTNRIPGPADGAFPVLSSWWPWRSSKGSTPPGISWRRFLGAFRRHVLPDPQGLSPSPLGVHPGCRPASWTEKWRGIIKDRALILPVVALALLSTILKRAPVPQHGVATLRQDGRAADDLLRALLRHFRGGPGLGSWIAHAQDAKKSGARSAASWLAMSALGTAGLVATWFLGASLPVVAGPGSSSLATAACQLLMTHRLQEYVAASGSTRNTSSVLLDPGQFGDHGPARARGRHLLPDGGKLARRVRDIRSGSADRRPGPMAPFSRRMSHER